MTNSRAALRFMLVLCALAGFGLSALLAAMSADPGAGWASGICTAGDGFGCTHALNSQFARVVGPITATHLGLAYFGMHLLWYGVVGIPNRSGRTWQLLIALVGVAGLFASATYVAIMVWRLPTMCQFCLAVHAVNLIMVTLGVMAWFKPRIDGAASTARPTRGMALGTISAGLAMALFAVVAVVGYQNQQAAFRLQSLYLGVVNDIDYIVWDCARQAQHEIPVYESDHQLGPADAANTLVVFSDFECAKCAGFHANAARLAAGFAPDVRIVFKHYPVSQKCNPHVERAFHPTACDAARAAIAVQQVANEEQSLAFTNLLFKNSEQLYSIEYLVKAAGVDASAFAKAYEDEATIEAALNRDIEIAHRIGVIGTPTFFLNGKQLSRWMIQTTDARPQPDFAATTKLWERLLNRPLNGKQIKTR